MLLVYLKGLLAGFLIGFSFGPAFFTNVNASISRGVKAGFLVALGISITDIIYSMSSVFGLSDIFQGEETKFWIGLLGGIIITIFGITSIIKPIRVTRMEGSSNKGLIIYFFQGIAVNGLNPFVIIFWAGAVTATYVEMEFTQYEAAVFFLGVLTTTLLMDFSKALLAHRIFRLIGSSRIQWFSKAIGLIFVIIGISLLSTPFLEMVN